MLVTDVKPHNTEVEQALLGAVLLDPDAIVDVLARMQAEDFYDPMQIPPSAAPWLAYSILPSLSDPTRLALTSL